MKQLDVYGLSIEYAGDTFRIAESLSGLHRHSRDQWLRAAQSIPLNIAEGNGKRSLKDRSRFFDIARLGIGMLCNSGRALISVAISKETSDSMKAGLKRIVAMLTRLAMRSDQVSESSAWYDDAAIDYEHEDIASLSTSDGRDNSRFGPEQTVAVERRNRVLSDGKSTHAAH